VYRTNLSPCFDGMRFVDIAKLVYEETATVKI
jgi:hypothetical protein